MNLTNNSNGIYIIKKILTFTQKSNFHEKLKTIVKKNALFLIKQSYGNFVIQVIIESWEDYKEITDLFKGHFFDLSESKCISDVMKSNYGNYVVQKVIKLASGESKKNFVFNAAKEIEKLNDNKLIQKWKSILSSHIAELNEEQVALLKEQNYFGKN